MTILTSIEALEPANIIQTQNKPVRVHASDLNFYYCKYHNNVGAAHRLFKELVVASFLSYYELNFAPVQLVKVLPEHVPLDLGIPINRFNTTCFGSQIINGAEDLNKVTEELLVNSRNRGKLKSDLLRLAFFDIWTCNEDRHTGNYNLLITYQNNQYELIPIDHEACFNHQNLERGLVSIDYESNLIYTTLFSKLYKPEEFRNDAHLVELKQTLYLCSQNCKANIKEILQNIPPDWNFDISVKVQELNQYLLNDAWFEECWQTFLEFLQYFGV